MANYDVASCEVFSNGWNINIKFLAMSTGGTYNFGLGTYNDPVNSKIKLTVVGTGYNSIKSLIPRIRTIYGLPCLTNNTGAMRKAYNQQTSPDETVDGSDVIIKFALSEPVYQGETVVISVGSGFYTENGHANNACTDLACTNSSTNTYQSICAKWLESQYDIITQDGYAELGVFHGHATGGKEVAAVEYTVSDQHSHSYTGTLTSMSVSDRADYNKVICYRIPLTVLTLTSGDMITVNVKLYPIIGSASTLLDSSLTGNTFPTPLFKDLVLKLYKNSERGHVCVMSGGNDTNGVVYSSQALAEAGGAANACATIAGALTKLQVYHNSNYSRNHAGGGFIYCDENTYTLNSNTAGGTLTEWVTITKLSTANRANVKIQAAAAESKIPEFLKLSYITLTGSTTYWNPEYVNSMWFDNVVFATTGTVTVYHCYYLVATYCSGTMGTRGYRAFDSNRTDWALIRGCNHTTDMISYGLCIVGCNGILVNERGAGAGSISPNGAFYAFNTVRTATATIINLNGANFDLNGYAIVQNLFERYGANTQAGILLGGDGSTHTTNNIIMQHNTFAGGSSCRLNTGYNDTARAAPTLHTNYFPKFNLIDNCNIKDDTYASDADCTGGWMVGYGVGFYNNVIRQTVSSEWIGENNGIWIIKGTATKIAINYVNDLSYGANDAVNTGGGDYHLQATSPAYAASKDTALPYDLEGNRRNTKNGSLGVYEMIPFKGSTIKNKKINISLGMGL